MSASTEKAQALKGAEWLVKESSPFETFIPEDFNEEQQMVKDMCNAFLDAEVLPIIDRIDKLEPGLMPSLIAKAGEQGLLALAAYRLLGQARLRHPVGGAAGRADNVRGSVH